MIIKVLKFNLFLLFVGLCIRYSIDEPSFIKIENEFGNEIEVKDARLLHAFINYDASDNSSFNEVESVPFIDKTNTDGLMGETEVLSRLEHQESANKLTLLIGEAHNYNNSFSISIRNDQTLLLKEDNSSWQKK